MPSPWASRPSISKPAAPRADRSDTAPTTPAVSATGAHAPAGQADSQQMQDVMAELQRLGALDPAARDQLTADLQHTDPALWPGLLHQARAVAAYRQRTATSPYPATDTARAPVAAASEGGAVPPGPLAARTPLSPAPKPDLSVDPNRSGAATEYAMDRLPVSSNAVLAPQEAPQERYPSTGLPAFEPGAATDETPAPAVSPSAPVAEPQSASSGQPPQDAGSDSSSAVHRASMLEDPVEGRLTSHTAEKPLRWTHHVDSAIRLLEKDAKTAPEEEIRLRMLYLAAERYDDAVRAVPALETAEQEFWTSEMHGLGTLLNQEKHPDGPSRTAEAKQVLAEAVSKLGELAPLVVRNLAFCTRVHSYGCFETFASYQFAPEQRVLLYAEVDNFTSDTTAKGHHTSLKSSYQIFDARGQRVADEALTSTEEICQNRRHDFFIVYDFYLPKRIYPGKHTLRLTIEDLKGKKIGDSSIDLEIVGESASKSP